MTKITDFCVISELGLMVVAGADLSLKLFEIDISQAEGVNLKYNSEVSKESAHRTL